MVKGISCGGGDRHRLGNAEAAPEQKSTLAGANRNGRSTRLCLRTSLSEHVWSDNGLEFIARLIRS